MGILDELLARCSGGGQTCGQSFVEHLQKAGKWVRKLLRHASRALEKQKGKETAPFLRNYRGVPALLAGC